MNPLPDDDYGSTPPQPDSRWQRMTRDERIAWVEAHKGQQIRYAKADEVEKGRRAFGPSFPIPWKETPLYGLAVDYRGRPSLAVKGPINFGVFGDTMHEPWDGLWDVRLVASDESHDDADGEPITTLDGCRRRIAELEEDNRFLTRRIAALGTHVPELWDIAEKVAERATSDAHGAPGLIRCHECSVVGQAPLDHKPGCLAEQAIALVKSKPAKGKE